MAKPLINSNHCSNRRHHHHHHNNNGLNGNPRNNTSSTDSQSRSLRLSSSFAIIAIAMALTVSVVQGRPVDETKHHHASTRDLHRFHSAVKILPPSTTASTSASSLAPHHRSSWSYVLKNTLTPLLDSLRFNTPSSPPSPPSSSSPSRWLAQSATTSTTTITNSLPNKQIQKDGSDDTHTTDQPTQPTSNLQPIRIAPKKSSSSTSTSQKSSSSSSSKGTMENPNVKSSPAIYYVPHQDDDALAMSLSIREHITAGRKVIVHLYSDGINPSLTNIMNGVLPCPLGHNATQHLNLNMTLDDEINGRTNEFRNSLNALGVLPENIFTTGWSDYEPVNDYTSFKEKLRGLIESYEQLYPGASHKCISGKLDRDGAGMNPTHHACWDVATELLEDYPEGYPTTNDFWDFRFYRTYTFYRPEDKREAQFVKYLPQHLKQKQDALDQYMAWDPNNKDQDYAWGYHSVKWLIDGSYHDPYCYMDMLTHDPTNPTNPNFDKVQKLQRERNRHRLKDNGGRGSSKNGKDDVVETDKEFELRLHHEAEEVTHDDKGIAYMNRKKEQEREQYKKDQAKKQQDKDAKKYGHHELSASDSDEGERLSTIVNIKGGDRNNNYYDRLTPAQRQEIEQEDDHYEDRWFLTRMGETVPAACLTNEELRQNESVCRDLATATPAENGRDLAQFNRQREEHHQRLRKLLLDFEIQRHHY